MARDTDFAAIVQAARLGAEWAWTALYREFSPRVLRYLKAHGAIEPEDLLGDVFVQVVRMFASFEGDESDFSAFVFTIARNRMIDDWRRRKRKPVATPLDDAPEVDAAMVGDASEDALRRLSDQRVRRIIEKLSPVQRDVMFLRVLASLTVREVACVLGTSEGAVKSAQTRAFAAMRQMLAEEGDTL